MNEDQENNLQKKFVLNFKKIPIIDTKKIDTFLGVLNKKDFGDEVRLEHVLSYFVENYKESDIEGIQTRGLSPWEKVRRKYILEKEEKNLEISFEDYIAKKMKV